jgi:hypothetical protein
VRFAAVIKALGINMFRAVKYVRQTGKFLEDQVVLGVNYLAWIIHHGATENTELKAPTLVGVDLENRVKEIFRK